MTEIDWKSDEPYLMRPVDGTLSETRRLVLAGRILQPDVVGRGGRIYPKETVQHIFNHIESAQLQVGRVLDPGDSFPPKLSDSAFKIEVIYMPSGTYELWCQVFFLDTPRGIATAKHYRQYVNATGRPLFVTHPVFSAYVRATTRMPPVVDAVAWLTQLDLRVVKSEVATPQPLAALCEADVQALAARVQEPAVLGHTFKGQDLQVKFEEHELDTAPPRPSDDSSCPECDTADKPVCSICSSTGAVPYGDQVLPCTCSLGKAAIQEGRFSELMHYLMTRSPAGSSARETQQSIWNWAEDTFGPLKSNMRMAVRANEEMAELLTELALDDRHPKAAAEIADVVINLYRLAGALGVDLDEEVNKKMQVNRARRWERDGLGCGRHVRESRQTLPEST